MVFLTAHFRSDFEKMDTKYNFFFSKLLSKLFLKINLKEF